MLPVCGRKALSGASFTAQRAKAHSWGVKPSKAQALRLHAPPNTAQVCVKQCHITSSILLPQKGKGRFGIKKGHTPTIYQQAIKSVQFCIDLEPHDQGGLIRLLRGRW